MRYAKGSLVISGERDIPLLRQVRNSRFVSHQQLFEFMKFSGFDRSRNSFNWRVRRLVKYCQLELCHGAYGAGSAVYRIDRGGLAMLEHHGQFTTVLHSNTEHLPHVSQVLHALELNRIQLALAHRNLLASWQSEVEVASFNTIAHSPYQKDYDAIVEVWMGDRTARFAIEYERTLKSFKQYERIRTALEAERQIGCILYLTSGVEVLLHLVREFESVTKPLAFANAGDFATTLLDTTVVTGRDAATARFRELLQ
ncbi:MAG: hypothetical protein ACRD2U_04375 [Terriglobales bacterium]